MPTNVEIKTVWASLGRELNKNEVVWVGDRWQWRFAWLTNHFATGSKLLGLLNDLAFCRQRKNQILSSAALREFKGRPDNWAPEELLVGSVNTCILLTFLTLAQGRGLIPAAYESEADGLLENVDGKFLMTEVTVRPRITVKSQVDVEPIREAINSANPVVSCRIR